MQTNIQEIKQNTTKVKLKNFSKNIKKQKYGWFTMFFYGIGNVFWAYANNIRKIVGMNHHINSNVSAVAGAFWITVIRETFYLILFLIYAGPNLFKRRFKDTFTKGGRLMIVAVFVNFIGNVMLSTGYVFLITAAFAGSIETSFIVFTFLATFLIFKQKFNYKTFIGVVVLLGFLGGLFVVQLKHNSTNGELSNQIIGAILIMAAQIGYMGKNIIGEYVFKHKLLGVEGVQFMATFWSPFIALIGTIIFLPILQPILVAATTQAHHASTTYLDSSPFMLFIYMLKSWKMLIMVAVASIFLLTGRNCQYQNTRVSGAALSNVFYQSKILVQAFGTVIAYTLVIGIAHTAWPVVTDSSNSAFHDPWLLLTSKDQSFFSLWYYWLLLLGLVTSVLYTTIVGQGIFESHQHKYRKNKGIRDEKIDYSITKNIGISRGSKTHKQK